MFDNIDYKDTKKRLASLKIRLEQVSTSWNIDNYQNLLRFYVRILPKIMDSERCTIFIIEMNTNQICSIFGTGIKEMKIKAPREGSIVGHVISSGAGIIKNDLYKEKGFHTFIDSKTGFITRNIACAPIKSLTGHGVTGAVQVLNKLNNQSFSESDLSLLEEVASFLSNSIESIILNQEIIRISNQLNIEVERFNRKYISNSLVIGESASMKEVLDLVKVVSATPVSVLIQGENGTGKELIAQMIHEGSSRHDKPFIAINCASIPDHLMESEFFGYEKGAFTGADKRRIGRFEEANGGTLLLDEVTDMPLNIQPKFLRAIQEGECQRLGGNKSINFDVRIICTSNKDLKKEVETGSFREDLYFRLFSVEIIIPPLRERKEDIIPLATAFLEETSRRFGKKFSGFSPEVFVLFEKYFWPGNVRQLRREIERLVTLTPDGEIILPNKCSNDLRNYNNKVWQNASSPFNYSIPKQVKSLEINLIKAALKETGGNRENTAKLLGITRQGLFKKIKRYSIQI